MSNIKDENEALLLDVYTPSKEDAIKYRPLLIYIHGGGFQNNTKNGITNTNKKDNNCPFIPRSVNACTEVSPKIPLRVKKVEYTINKKLRPKNK